MATADLNYCTHTCSCILNLFPKPYCKFVVILVVVPGASASVRIVNFSSVKAKYIVFEVSYLNRQ